MNESNIEPKRLSMADLYGNAVEGAALWLTDGGIEKIMRSMAEEIALERVREIVQQELEIFFMRRDPLFQKILKEINEHNKT
jgi:hypothetical protein